MDFYRKLIIKILENNFLTQEDYILKKLKNNIDLNNEDKIHLEELISSIL